MIEKIKEIQLEFKLLNGYDLKKGEVKMFDDYLEFDLKSERLEIILPSKHRSDCKIIRIENVLLENLNQFSVFENLEELYLNKAKVKQLEGLEKLENLRVLSLRDYTLDYRTMIRKLQVLPHLKMLHLRGKEFENLSNSQKKMVLNDIRKLEEKGCKIISPDPMLLKINLVGMSTKKKKELFVFDIKDLQKMIMPENFILTSLNYYNREYKMQLWFSTHEHVGLRYIFYLGSFGIILCCDRSEQDTLEKLDKLVMQIYEGMGDKFPPVMLLTVGDGIAMERIEEFVGNLEKRFDKEILVVDASIGYDQFMRAFIDIYHTQSGVPVDHNFENIL